MQIENFAFFHCTEKIYTILLISWFFVKAHDVIAQSIHYIIHNFLLKLNDIDIYLLNDFFFAIYPFQNEIRNNSRLFINFTLPSYSLFDLLDLFPFAFLVAKTKKFALKKYEKKKISFVYLILIKQNKMLQVVDKSIL